MGGDDAVVVGGGGAAVPGDSDDKYSKIRRRRSRLRRLALLALLAAVALAGAVLLSALAPRGGGGAEDSPRTAGPGRGSGRAVGGPVRGGGGGGGGGEGEAERDGAEVREAGRGAVAAAAVRRDLRPVKKAADGGGGGGGGGGGDEVGEADLAARVEALDAEVRKIKLNLPEGKFMETDPSALDATRRLQDATRALLAERYGPAEPYRVRVTLEFQDTIPDFAQNGPDGSLLLEMAPSKLVPHSVYSFLEIARNWKGGAFHRIAGHVLQVMVGGRNGRPLAFQEYSEEFPHKKGTVGYAGRPSGPAWYVSIQDNSHNHGPGSQQKKNPHEADSCFGRVIQGFDTDVQRIRKIPGNGFIGDRKKHVLIKEMQILVPGEGRGAVDGYVPWSPKEAAAAAVRRRP